MTLNEDCMDESDTERDTAYVDYNLVKKFTSKLPRLGTSIITGRRAREAERAPNSSSSRFPQLSPLSVVVPDIGDTCELLSNNRVRGESVGPESKQHFFRSPEAAVRETFNNFSPSHDSQDSNCSSDVRKKKKPLFQRMLEKAREEDHKGNKQDKPLYQRIIEKAQAESDRDEKLKDAAAVKRLRLPKIPKLDKLSPLRPERASPNMRKSNERLLINASIASIDLEKLPPSPRGVLGVLQTGPKVLDGLKDVSKSEKKLQSIRSPVTPAVNGLNYSPSAESIDAQQKRRVAKKPLFQRLAERAQADEEKLMREKMEQYNMRRILKKKSNAPSREEIKERIDQGLARNDGGLQNIKKEQDEKDKDRDKDRDRDREGVQMKKRQRAVGVQSLPRSAVMGMFSPLKSQGSQNPFAKQNIRRRGKERSKMGSIADEEEEEDEGYRGDDGDIDSVVKKVKSRNKPRALKGRARTLEKIPSSKRRGEELYLRIGEEEMYVSESEKKRMADMMSELHDEQHHLFDDAIPMVSYDSPSSLNLSGNFTPRNDVIDDIDALFSPLSAVSNDSDSFIRKMKHLSGEISARSKGENAKAKARGRFSPRDNRDDFDFSFDRNVDDGSDDGHGKRNSKLDLSDGKKRKKASEAASNSRVRFLSHNSEEASKNDLHRSSVYPHQPSVLVGAQWVAEILESDENESGLVMMYSEGFSMFMAEVHLGDIKILYDGRTVDGQVTAIFKLV